MCIRDRYTTGAGSEDARPFSMVRIYLNQGKEFLFAEGLSISIGNSLEVSDEMCIRDRNRKGSPADSAAHSELLSAHEPFQESPNIRNRSGVLVICWKLTMLCIV